MEKNSPRRAFLKKSAFAATGITLLSSQAIHALTADLAPFEGYNPYTAEKSDLRTSIFGNHITVTGHIFNADGSRTLANAQVEVWHLSPGSSKYKHRGKLTTDSQGRYRFQTDFPNKEKGKSARIYFRVSQDGAVYYTELVLSQYGAFITSKHWEKNKVLAENLYPKYTQTFGQPKIDFNIALSNNI